MKRRLYLHSWIDFGKYRGNPKTLKSVLDTPEGRDWALWLHRNSYTMELDGKAIEYLKLQEEHDRYLLPTSGGQQL